MWGLHKGPKKIFQGVLILFGGISVGIGWADSSRVQFGDPDSSMGTPETSCENCATSTQTSSLIPLDPKVDQKVREIIKSIKPGDPYPDQFKKIMKLGEPSIPSLLLIFKDSSFPWENRFLSAMALGRLGGNQAIQGLTQGLSDSLPTLRLGSVVALSKIQDPAVLPFLRKALSDPAMVVRDGVVKALQSRRDHESVSLLNEELHAKRNFGKKGQSLWIRKNILEALADLGHAESIPAVLSVLNEKELGMRLMACGTLSKMNPQAPAAQENPTSEKCVQRWLDWKKEQKL